MRSYDRKIVYFLLCGLLSACLTACAASDSGGNPSDRAAVDGGGLDGSASENSGGSPDGSDGSDGAAESAPAPIILLLPEASGTLTQENERAAVDYSNTGDGYVMVRCSDSGKRLKAQVAAATTYTYDLPPDTWTAFPLSDGDGSYKVSVFENIEDSKYAAVLSAEFSVTLADEFAPFLRPNQYVNYADAPAATAKAAELCGGLDGPLQKVEAIYDFVVDALVYDFEKAENVQPGYLPVLDDVLAAKTGICFDYAALMTGMLRCQGVPCKLVVGYAGTDYHAWVSVWTAESGWIDGIIYFDGVEWQRMDPTFISSGKGSESARKFVGDGSNYTEKYLY